MRRPMMLTLVPLLLSVAPPAQGQYLPRRPIFPTDPEDCRLFNAEVEEYRVAYDSQHEKCLRDNEPDRPNEPPDSPICSRSRCQDLHDRVYGSSILSVESFRREVEGCFTEVREYQTKQAKKPSASNTQPPSDHPARPVVSRAAPPTNSQPRSTSHVLTPRIPSAPTRSPSPPPSEAKNQGVSKRTHDPNLGLVDPFHRSELGEDNEDTLSAALVDPFPSKEKLANSFPNSEETWEGAKRITEGLVAKAPEFLDASLDRAERQLPRADFRKFEPVIENARSFVVGLGRTITIINYRHDMETIIKAPMMAESYHDLIVDISSQSFSYVLKRLSPDFLSKIWEGPPGWAAAITFDSSHTQSKQQDYDPIAVLNDSENYTFQQRETALQELYQLAGKHPELWDAKRHQWLYGISNQLYNSADNPNIHLSRP